LAAGEGRSKARERPTSHTLYDRTVRTVVSHGERTGHLEVTVTLQDDCLGLGGYRRVHDMRLFVEIRQSDLEIVRAEADMSAHPHMACVSTIPDVQRLLGLRIAGGVNAELRSRLGGSRSCNHLHTMAQSAAQTVALSHVSSLQDEDPIFQQSDYAPFYRRAIELAPRVVNTCAVWRADGPVVPDLTRKPPSGRTTP